MFTNKISGLCFKFPDVAFQETVEFGGYCADFRVIFGFKLWFFHLYIWRGHNLDNIFHLSWYLTHLKKKKDNNSLGYGKSK